MDTRTNTQYRDKEFAKLAGAKLGDLKQLPDELQEDANKALGDKEQMYIPKKSKDAHIQRLAQFALGERRKKSKKKNRNRTSRQSRKKNR